MLPIGADLKIPTTAVRLNRYTTTMTRLLALSALVALSLTACAGGRYSMDMTGLDRASTENVNPISERYTMTELDTATTDALGQASDKYSMTTLNDLSSEAFDPYTRGK